MREIKFRVWHKGKKIISEVFGIDILHKEIFFSNGDVDYCEISDFKYIELMEYTGLKDKNNKEIYEGDIVTLHNGKYKVIFNSKEARFVLRDDEFEMNIPFTNNNNKRMEVVGNIYENPELIKEVR
ncbi:YopX family protein [Fusobacterium pseudoperiodonticum]|uniref:YopX family protein n=1 Tax=Fusobacterium pseudoperiodonticum TaxID=2663009 RepID=UPI0028E6F250|nr:YopX family protein [Fusobacterium pseudoperiodonticum]